MPDFNRHDARAGHCTGLQVNVLTLGEKRAQLEREGRRALTSEEEALLFPEGDGPLKGLHVYALRTERARRRHSNLAAPGAETPPNPVAML